MSEAWGAPASGSMGGCCYCCCCCWHGGCCRAHKLPWGCKMQRAAGRPPGVQLRRAGQLGRLTEAAAPLAWLRPPACPLPTFTSPSHISLPGPLKLTHSGPPHACCRSKVLKIWSWAAPHHRSFQLSWISFMLAFFASFAAPPMLPTIRCVGGGDNSRAGLVHVLCGPPPSPRRRCCLTHPWLRSLVPSPSLTAPSCTRAGKSPLPSQASALLPRRCYPTVPTHIAPPPPPFAATTWTSTSRTSLAPASLP